MILIEEPFALDESFSGERWDLKHQEDTKVVLYVVVVLGMKWLRT